MKRVKSLAFGIVAVALLAGGKPPAAPAQTVQSSLKHSCQDATRAFAQRQTGMEQLTVADPAATANLRQAALVFYRCAQREQDPYIHDLFMAYYANTLYRVGQNTNDPRAISLAASAARRVDSSFDDVRALVENIIPPEHHQQPAPTTTSAPTHSAAYCRDLAPNVISVLEALDSAVNFNMDAGNNDTVIATTTARYGGAFKSVEDDFTAAQGRLTDANSALNTANGATSELNDYEKPAAVQTLQVLNTTITYTDTYSRLALTFERGINGANRQLARARLSQSLASGMHDTSYTYSNGNASCYSYSAYSTNCYGNSNSTTTYNNSATIAQQNAANALAEAQAGRLSYARANAVLTEGLPVLQQIHGAVSTALDSWNKVCART